jgi:WD40 repeat protein
MNSIHFDSIILIFFDIFEPIQRPTNRIPKRREMELYSHQQGVNCIRWSRPYGHLLASGSMDQTVTIYDPFRTKQQIIILRHHKGDSYKKKLVNLNNQRTSRLYDLLVGIVIR